MSTKPRTSRQKHVRPPPPPPPRSAGSVSWTLGEAAELRLGSWISPRGLLVPRGLSLLPQTMDHMKRELKLTHQTEETQKQGGRHVHPAD